jgi:hypothetical protein
MWELVGAPGGGARLGLLCSGGALACLALRTQPPLLTSHFPPPTHQPPHPSKENILFGQPFDPYRYDDVIHACALGLDLEILPDGDESKVRVCGRGWRFRGPRPACSGLAHAQGERTPAAELCSSATWAPPPTPADPRRPAPRPACAAST